MNVRQADLKKYVPYFGETNNPNIETDQNESDDEDMMI
jgi:hypothetical protein